MDFEDILPIAFLLIYFLSLARKRKKAQPQRRAESRPRPTGSSPTPSPPARTEVRHEWEAILEDIKEVLDEKSKPRQPLPPPAERLPELEPRPVPVSLERKPPVLPAPVSRAPAPVTRSPEAQPPQREGFINLEARTRPEEVSDAHPKSSAPRTRRAGEPAAASTTGAQTDLAEVLKRPLTIRDALVLAEVLGPPRSKQRH